jgi:hypothetical protein
MKSSKLTFGSKRIDRATLRNVLIAVYVLVVLGFSATVKAGQVFLPVQPSQKWALTKVSGLLVHTLNGWQLVVSETERFVLVSKEDLTNFDRKVVMVIGLEAKVTTGVQHDESLVPLTEDSEQQDYPVLSVLQISEEL